MRGELTEAGRALMLSCVFTPAYAVNQSSFFVALTTITPSGGDDSAELVEPSSGAGYSRAEVPVNTGWELDGGQVYNTADLSFGIPTEDWGLLRAWALVDSEGDGLVLAFGSLDEVEVVVDEEVLAPSGALTLRLGPVTL